MSKIGTWQLVAAGTAVAGLALGFLLGGGRSGGSSAAAVPFANTSATAPAGSAGIPGITVTGSGTVSGTPDTLKAVLGVEVTKPSVSEALDEANRTTAAVQKVLRDRGVADKDLQTSGVTVQPQYDYSSNKPVVTGYTVNENLNATLRNLKTAGATISAAAVAGGNATRVQSVSLDLSDTSALVTAARQAAFSQAKDKATQYAKAAGTSLGPVTSITEAVTTPPARGEAFAAPMATAAAGKIADVPVAAGSQDVVVTVTVVFGLT